MIVTQVTWPGVKEEFTLQTACHVKAAELGGSEWGRLVEDDTKFIVQRSWNSEELANQWIAFVLELGAESAVIVDEPTP